MAQEIKDKTFLRLLANEAIEALRIGDWEARTYKSYEISESQSVGGSAGIEYFFMRLDNGYILRADKLVIQLGEI